MSGGMIGRLLGNMDEDAARNVLDSMDDAMIERALEAGIEQELVPHLVDVRENAAKQYPEADVVRARYEGLSEEEQEVQFEKAAADLMAVAVELRENPTTGLRKLKGRLRDPWTIEALLLIFDAPGMSDEEVQARKDYASMWLKWVGSHVIPEVYERDDVRDVIEQMYPSEDPDELLDELNVGE